MMAAHRAKYSPVERPKPFRHDAAYLRLKKRAKALERETGDGKEISGTGLTILKLQGSPLSRLADRGSIGKLELDAADDIHRAYMAICGDLLIRPQSYERTDRTNNLYEPHGQIDAVSRYRAWANHWSGRKARGDRTLEIVIDVVIDERPMRQIEQNYSLKHGRAAIIVGSALRDYVARAGWAPKDVAREWMAAAASNFRLRRLKAA